MSREETSELRAYIVNKTDAAYQLTNRKNPVDQPEKPRTFWLPRSLMGRTNISKTTDAADPHSEIQYPYIICQVPDWKIEQENLWDFVP